MKGEENMTYAEIINAVNRREHPDFSEEKKHLLALGRERIPEIKPNAWRDILETYHSVLYSQIKGDTYNRKNHYILMEMDCLEHVISLDDFYDYCAYYMKKKGINQVVDIGCAFGHQAEVFLQEGLAYTGIEICRYKKMYKKGECSYIFDSYPCKIPEESGRFAVSNMCFEYFINDYKALARDFDEVILSGIVKKDAEIYFDIQEVCYRISGNTERKCYVLKRKCEKRKGK